MRVGKKANVVEAKKTRSCVVRLEKVSSPPIKVTRSSGITSRGIQLHTEEKRFKGPIKKRPIAQSSSIAVSTSAAPPISETSTKSSKVKEMKEKFKTPIRGGQKAEVVKPAVSEPPTPTLATGRSRRAIKPNPKYASDDMVTPKIIRNVSAIAGSSSSSKRPTIVPEKQRKRSTSSSDDFFNKDSSDELGANDFDDEVDKMYQELEKESDSDFSDEPKLSESAKKRGRPKRGMQATPSSTPASAPRPTPTPQHKGQTSQLQLLRKSFAASVNRSIEPSAGMKRKHNDSIGSSSDNDNDASGVVRKRILLTKSAIAREGKISNSTNISMLVRKPNPTLNGSRILKIKSESMDIEKSKRSPTIIEKRTLIDGNSVPIRINQQSKQLQTMRTLSNNTSASATTTRTLITTSSKTPNARVLAEAKRRSASPAISKVTKPTDDKIEDSKIKIMQGTSPSKNNENDELMPTFTIVNINDIINKKGDVLISKTGRPHNESVKSEQTSVPESAKIIEQKPGLVRRKGLLAEKGGEMNRLKNPMPPTKKPTQRILNHTLLKKSPPDTFTARNKVKSLPVEKPAPRILNSVVAKKTQPVKPMIANFDDSADDEIYPLSFDGDEDADEDDGEDTNDTGELEEDIDDAEESFEVGKSRLPSSTPYQPKKSAPSSKENSQVALNRQQPAKNVIQRKITPEKVIISRQGDKIVKKITCFETWYVIIPEEIKPKVSRNILEIPLIKLANIATEICLPTDDWKSKVTLHELSPSMIAKTNLITYTGDLKDYNISEKDRSRYQPSCVMFRRSVNDRTKSRLPYDRAVIFKNKTFFTNIEGKNVKLVGAPSTISTQKDVEILLQIVDSLTLQSSLVEPTNTTQ
ncbi:uncharacterized protein LOC101448529 [Ceratitis capitata]|uniref:Uncharacterized protein n=1 Tax=Ceratitis capitata TaxID=7213 RepID=W8C8E5_CERCA|nr:uncharacterized protein LOC101448529 [Ceratitis capitata]XP_012161017.1 uncharacterized protein LOC101448529 [Ceratitis capitata]XP_012161018.1 uncharacterized protein LOC101448529 [Ceratitis capitata]